MPQVIRPDASTTRTPPTGHSLPAIRGQTTMHGCMDEVAPVAADYTECGLGSVGDVLVVGLGDPTTTPAHDRNHVVAFCASKDASGGAAIAMVCELRQGYNSEGDTTSTTTLDGALTATATSVAVVDGSVFAVNDVIRVEGERMLITAISVNTLTVTRGVQGTVAVAHITGLTVFDINEGLLVASFVGANIPSTVDTYFRYRLTDTEAARITDYTDLQLRFLTLNARGGAPRACRLHWAGCALPNIGDRNEDSNLTPEETRRKHIGLGVVQESDGRTTGSTIRPF